MSEVTGKAWDTALLKRVLAYVKPYRKTFIITGILVVLLAILGPIRPWIIQHTIDVEVAAKNEEGVLYFTLLLIAVLIIEAVVQFFQTYMANWLGQSVIKDMRVQLYKHILSFRLKYFDRTAIGTLVTRNVSDIETIANIFAEGILVIFGDILKLLAVIVFMFYTDWLLTLISLIPIPILIFATSIFKRVIKKAFQDVRTQVSRLNAFVQERVTGMKIIQIFNRETIEMERFKEMNKLHRNAHIRTVWAYSVFFPIVEMLSATSLGLLVWWGTKSVLGGYTTLGNLVAFILYIYMLYRPIRQLADRFNTLQMGMVSSERVFKVLDTKSNIEDEGEVLKEKLEGLIEFNQVWFAYVDQDYVLKNISFSAMPGETIAFVGATGSGKTSTINLLGRFYEFERGEIKIDGVKVQDYNLDNLRQNMAVVLQDVFLFSDTILNNITLYNTEISLDDVIKASKKVGAHGFISKLPGAYHYNVKERGGALSVGQRQLISFIRAYVHNPSILILDEATSSIDTESEILIQKATDVLTSGRTSIVIAHRLSTIQKADRIIVLEAGEIIEQGSHQELLAMNGHYKKLFELQFKEE
ncbi:MAG: ABC transporter ATP-binding protein [Bacteroidetes bacterium]|nr:MAG: ABC transporter ATP-binding protein [Bacteroidota bacterium]MBL1144664.1 ABC transporter ATP-binding protein [Bacteroidota bacterium]NOG57459.1 ABC transporter ATP-binding protein [Bacteroidota bacterium]